MTMRSIAWTAPPADLLATIVAATRRIVEVRQQRQPMAALMRKASAVEKEPHRLLAALCPVDRVNVIAECKRRSPSRGVLRAEYDPVAIARGYRTAGAAAISVLTEPTFFDGSLGHLEAVAAAVDVPLLRKDFVVSEYQLVEAKAAGADAVLLIVAALEPRALASLVAGASALGLDALVEVHDASEIAAAIDAGACLIGVNNRDLRTLQVSLDVSERLIAHIPRDAVAVSESGLNDASDIVRLRAAGYHAFLVGERFMTQADPGRALAEVLSSVRSTVQ